MHAYEALASLSKDMLSAARKAEWDLLLSLEQNSRVLVGDLCANGPSMAEEEEHTERRHEIIREILAEDAEIRSLVEPRLAELKRFLTSFSLERNLRQSYSRDESI